MILNLIEHIYISNGVYRVLKPHSSYISNLYDHPTLLLIFRSLINLSHTLINTSNIQWFFLKIVIIDISISNLWKMRDGNNIFKNTFYHKILRYKIIYVRVKICDTVQSRKVNPDITRGDCNRNPWLWGRKIWYLNIAGKGIKMSHKGSNI